MAFNLSEEKSRIYKLVSDYFNNPLVTKIRNTDLYSLYYAKIGGMLSIENRYIVVICPLDVYPLNTSGKLSELEWVSFQTRTINRTGELTHLKTQNYKAESNRLIDDQINLLEKRDDRYIYKCQSTYLLKCELLFTNQNKFYNEQGTIKAALETYNCILNMVM